MSVDYHGKEYITVVERMSKLIEDHKKEYSLTTKLLSCDDKKVVVQANLSFGGNEYTGLAMEIIGGNFVNEFSALENCETSAIGRALSSAGYFGTEFCSANELENAVNQQKGKPKPIPKGTNPITGDGSDVITFGKHKGKNWNEVDEGWLKWIVDNNEKYKDKAQSILDSRFNDEEFTQAEIDAAEKKNEQAIADQDKIPF